MDDALRATLAAPELRYSQVWEDQRMLRRGLRVAAGDHPLVVASGGDNALAMLLADPARVTAVDVSPAQTALVRLKLAALVRLDHADFVAFLGARPCGDRLALYDRVRTALDDASRARWDAEPQVLEAGVLGAGRLERYFAAFGPRHLDALVPLADRRRLLALRSPGARRRLFARTLGRPEVERAFVHYFGRESMAARGRDPAQFRHVAIADVGRYFWERFTWACTGPVGHDNFYLERFLTDTVEDLRRGPAYLRPQCFEVLRARAGRVAVETAALGEVADASPAGSFTQSGVSDVFEYASSTESEALLTALARGVRPGGRLAYWNLLVPRERPRSLARRLLPLRREARSLWRRDRSWFYSAFRIEEVQA